MTRQFSVIRQFHPLVALAAFVVFTAPTPSADAAQPRAAVVVEHADLKLDTAKGAEAMLRRMERAANVACGVDPYRRGFADRTQRTCRTEALGRAVARLNSPLVSFLYTAREGGRTVFAAR